MSFSLLTFDILCRHASKLDALRDTVQPGSYAWVALTEYVQLFDRLIDTLVESDGFDDILPDS